MYNAEINNKNIIIQTQKSKSEKTGSLWVGAINGM